MSIKEIVIFIFQTMYYLMPDIKYVVPKSNHVLESYFLITTMVIGTLKKLIEKQLLWVITLHILIFWKVLMIHKM